MGIENPNYQTSMPVVLAKAEPSVNFTFVDIGARGGGRSEWLPYQKMSKFVAFEPDIAEADRIRNKIGGLDVHSIALGENTCKRQIYLTRSPDCSGLTQLDKVFWMRFPNWVNAEVVGTTEVEVKSLDEWVAGTEYKTLDFLKIDTEGSEIEILRGAKNAFEEKKYLVFWQSGGPSFTINKTQITTGSGNSPFIGMTHHLIFGGLSKIPCLFHKETRHFDVLNKCI